MPIGAIADTDALDVFAVSGDPELLSVATNVQDLLEAFYQLLGRKISKSGRRPLPSCAETSRRSYGKQSGASEEAPSKTRQTRITGSAAKCLVCDKPKRFAFPAVDAISNDRRPSPDAAFGVRLNVYGYRFSVSV